MAISFETFGERREKQSSTNAQDWIFGFTNIETPASNVRKYLPSALDKKALFFKNFSILQILEEGL